MKKDQNLLISLLKEAANEMKVLGESSTPWSHYDTCQDLGIFIEKAAEKLDTDNEEDVVELWHIFAPTSDWDDSGGSLRVADRIFELIDKLYGAHIRSKLKK